MSATGSALLAPDPALPERDTLLDPGAMATRLGGSIAAIVLARYQPRRSLRVLYRIDDVLVSMRTGMLPGGRHDPDLDATFWTFPADHRLDRIGALMQPSPRLRAALPGWSRSELVSYVPEKSVTVRCRDAAGGLLAYAKYGDTRPADRTLLVHEHVGGPRAWVASGSVLLVDAVPGCAIADVRDEAANDAFRAWALALAQLHGKPPIDDRTFDRHTDGRITAAAAVVAAIRPDDAAAAAAVAHRLVACRPTSPVPTCVHGDVHGRNVIVADGHATLLDLEQVAAGPAAADLGELVAWASVDGNQDLAGAAVDAYRSTGRPMPEAELRWHTAAALLVERIARAVTRLRPAVLARLPELLDDTAALLES